MDPFGLLPPSVRANYEREQVVDRHLQSSHALATALNKMDPRIAGVTFFDERGAHLPGVTANRWHVWRRNEGGAPDSYFPITTPDGGYREPDFGVLDELQRRDYWTRGDAAMPAKAKSDTALKDEQRRDELAADLKAASRVAGDGGITKRKWAQK